MTNHLKLDIIFKKINAMIRKTRCVTALRELLVGAKQRVERMVDSPLSCQLKIAVK